MAGQVTNEPAEGAVPLRPVERQRRRFGPVGFIMLSPDFIVAVLVAVTTALLAALSKTVGSQVSAVLLVAAGILATLAGIVIAAHTIMIGLITPEYMQVIERTASGIRGVSRPYRIVVWVCAAGALVALLSALVWPLIPSDAFWVWRLVRGTSFGVSIGLGAYGLVAAAQLAGNATFHFEQRAYMQRALREARRRNDVKRGA